jgi:flagellar motor switch protein FliG
LLVRAYGIRRSGELLSRINDAGGDVPTWDQLLEKSGEVVMSEVLSSEHPGIAALVMSSLPPKKAAGLLSKLSEDFQTEALKAMCSGRKIPAELAEKVRRGLADKLSRMKSAGGGVNKEEAKATASLFSQMSSEAARKSLEAVRARDPELASAIESSLLTFVDLLRLDDKDMQRALAKINQNDLKLALRKCDEAVANKIFKNMSDRVVAALKEDIKIMAPQKMAAIQDAQRKIVDIILKMRDAGEIVLKAADGAVSSGGDEEMV